MPSLCPPGSLTSEEFNPDSINIIYKIFGTLIIALAYKKTKEMAPSFFSLLSLDRSDVQTRASDLFYCIHSPFRNCLSPIL
jgi:hypothetical protein